MAANDSKWYEGELEVLQSSGTTPTVRWFEGELLVVHEFVAAGVDGNPWYYYAQQ